MSNEITKLRHSAAHILALAVAELHKDAKFGTCGIVDTGFYYDIAFDQPISSDQLPVIEQKMREIIEQNLPITTQIRTRDEMVDYFIKQEQPYKRELLEESRAKRTDVVVIGNELHVDTCVAAIVSSTGLLKHFMLTDVSGAYWKGEGVRPMLTRISGVCFESEEELTAYKEYRAELARRDHRVLGKKLGYFTVNSDVGTGLVFWSPRGAYVKHILTDLASAHAESIGAEYIETPLLGNSEQTKVILQPAQEQLVAKSTTDDEEKKYAIRQQFLTSHIHKYADTEHSYRDLPWRVAEIGKVVRYEKTGNLEGLVRAREVTQDTITIICIRDQVEKEMESVFTNAIEILREVGLSDFEIALHFPEADTKGKKQDEVFLSGVIKTIARKLAVSVTEVSSAKAVHEAEMVFTVRDSLKQKRELSKIQVLFTVPLEQGITYVGKDGESHAPVIIRATLLGSIERMIAVLIEHYAGVLPLWMTYEQCRILPMTGKQEMYADKILKQLKEFGIRATIDHDSEPIEGKIKQAEEDKVPYMLIVGEKEQSTNGVAVRLQGKGDLGLLDVDTFIKEVQKEVITKSIKSMLV